MDIAKLAREIRAFGYNAFRATGVGRPAFVTQQFNDATANPSPGDLVIEISTYWNEDRALDAVGYFEGITYRPIEEDDFAATLSLEEGKPPPGEEIQTIRTLDGRTVDWSDARFIRLPTTLFPPSL